MGGSPGKQPNGSVRWDDPTRQWYADNYGTGNGNFVNTQGQIVRPAEGSRGALIDSGDYTLQYGDMFEDRRAKQKGTTSAAQVQPTATTPNNAVAVNDNQAGLNIPS